MATVVAEEEGADTGGDTAAATTAGEVTVPAEGDPMERGGSAPTSDGTTVVGGEVKEEGEVTGSTIQLALSLIASGCESRSSRRPHRPGRHSKQKERGRSMFAS